MAAEVLVILIPNLMQQVKIGPILHKFEHLKIANFFNSKEVYFLVTRVICGYVCDKIRICFIQMGTIPF